MKIEQLYAFKEIADSGTIRKASLRLFTTPQNLSKLAMSLEEELGVTLYERSRTGITLTEEGKQAYDLILNVIKDLEALNTAFHVTSPQEEKLRKLPVYIACGSVLEPLASAATNYLLGEFPDVSIQLEKEASALIITNLVESLQHLEDLPDIAIIALHTKSVSAFAKSIEKYYDCFGLFEDVLSLQVPKNDPLAELDAVPLSVIENLPLLLYNGNPRKKTAAEKLLAAYGHEPKNVSRTSNLETCSRQALNQKKYCFVGYPSVEFRPLPNVVYVPFEVSIASQHMMLRKKTALNTPFCDAFINYFFDYYGSNPII